MANEQPNPLWITEADVVELMHLGEAIDALEGTLKLEAEGKARPMNKTHQTWEAEGGLGTLHAIGATVEGAQTIGTKTWAHTPGGATPLLMLWDSDSGRLKCIIEAFALGQMRTGAMSGLATRWMAAEDADTFALIGTGKQAITQVAAVAAVRPVKTLKIFSPTPDKRRAFIEKLREEAFNFEIRECVSAAEACEGASIVTAITRAKEAFLDESLLQPGAHLNAVGAITPERCEFDGSVLPLAAMVAVDNVDSVRRLSQEFQKHYGEDEEAWRAVRPISAVIAEGKGRPADARLTLFKAMGMGLSDLAVGIELFERAKAAGKGRVFEHPVKVKPRLKGE